MRTSRISLVLALLASLAGCAPDAPPVTPPPPVASAPPVFPPPEPAGSLSIADDPAAAARIAADVRHLASPELAGRGTGEPGARMAADFVIERFRALGLAPLGTADAQHPAYEQAFPAKVGAKVHPPSLALGGGRAKRTADKDAIVTADGSASGEVSGKAVFVGYGITAPAIGWDDYAGRDLEGKIAVVLDGAPAPEGKQKALKDFGGVRYKLRTAREHKAAGVVVVTRGDLPPAPGDPSSMGVPAVVLRQGAARALFPGLGLDRENVWAQTKPGKPREVPGGAVSLATHVEPLEATAWNVVGLLPARPGAATRDEIVVIGAHYDHLGGHGSRFSRAPGSHAIHPGADDNASGTALLLEVARRLAALPRRPDRSFVFMAFGAEELGAIGSRYWIDHPTAPLDRVVAMINADMVGRLREGRLVVDGTGTAAGWPALVKAANDGLGLDLALGAEGFGASDHASFTAARVPVAFLFTGVHDDYHLPSDTADKINADGEARVATLAARLALAVAERPERLAFVDAPKDPHAGGRGGFKVSLGTIPDYAFDGKGVKLTGVRPDSPAARSGMQAGDVIVKVGAHAITNVHDYVFALGELEAGREVVVEVERAGKRVPIKVIPAPGR